MPSGQLEGGVGPDRGRTVAPVRLTARSPSPGCGQRLRLDEQRNRQPPLRAGRPNRLDGAAARRSGGPGARASRQGAAERIGSSSEVTPSASSTARRRRTVPSASAGSPASICARAASKLIGDEVDDGARRPRLPAPGRRGLGIGLPARLRGVATACAPAGHERRARSNRARLRKGPRTARRALGRSQEAPRDAEQVVDGDRLEVLDHLVDREDPRQERLARPDPSGHGAGVLHAQLEAAAGVGAGTLELLGDTGSVLIRSSSCRMAVTTRSASSGSKPAWTPNVPASAYIALNVETS